MKYPEPEPPQEKHAMAETRNWREQDRFLRLNGFEIHARPRQGPNRWRHIRTNEVMDEIVALALVRREK
jgi:hypothetical protein